MEVPTTAGWFIVENPVKIENPGFQWMVVSKNCWFRMEHPHLKWMMTGCTMTLETSYSWSYVARAQSDWPPNCMASFSTWPCAMCWLASIPDFSCQSYLTILKATTTNCSVRFLVEIAILFQCFGCSTPYHPSHHRKKIPGCVQAARLGTHSDVLHLESLDKLVGGMLESNWYQCFFLM